MSFLCQPWSRFLHLFLLILFVWADLTFLPGKAFGSFSVKDEQEIGEKLLSIVRKEFKLLDDPDISQYVNRLGKEILLAAGPQYFDYNFFVIRNKDFNAFAAPSGLIFFHSGLIEAMNSENELVGVMAHEIGHAASRHIASRMAKSSKVGIGTAALVLAGIVLGGGALSQALITGGMAAGASMNLKFSRQDEEEADRLAFQYMKSRDRDPAAMVEMLRKMRNLSRYRQDIPSYLLTHPEPERRLNYVQDLLLMDRGAHFSELDDFAFQRIRYRIMALTRDPMSLLPLLAKEAEALPEKAGKKESMVFYGLSQLYLATANFSKAEEALEKVRSHYPEQHILTTDLGVILAESGRYQEALAIFEQVHAQAPDSAYNTFQLARTMQQLGKQAAAQRLYEDLVPVLPFYSRLYYQLGQVNGAQGQPEAGYYYLGVYHWCEGEAEKAKLHLQKAIGGLPAESELRRKAQDLLEKIKRLEKE